MANMSAVKMTPVDGGDSVDIPSGKTTIGRGAFLQVWSAVAIVAKWFMRLKKMIERSVGEPA